MERKEKGALLTDDLSALPNLDRTDGLLEGEGTGGGFHSRFSSLASSFSSLLVHSVDVDYKSPIMRETRRMRMNMIILFF